MPASNVAAEKRSQPKILVETAGLSEEEWLAYRRKGIGGSDVAALLGISPWRTARDLYFDKLNIVAVEDNEDNWVALEMGHLLEPLVAKIFQHRTGYKVYQIKKMFQHPQYSWMLADVDYFVELPDGSTAILEIKTTNYNARDNWWLSKRNTHAPGMKPNNGRPAHALQLRGPGLPLPVILLPSEKQYHSRIRPVQQRSTRRYPCCLLNLRCGRRIGSICAPLNAGCLMSRLTHWALRVPHRIFYAGLLQNG